MVAVHVALRLHSADFPLSIGADEHWEQDINSPLVASIFYPAKHVGFNHFDQSF